MEFWRYHCGENFRLPTPLGNWVNPSHREWEWFYNRETDSLLRKTGDLITSFVRKMHSRGRVWSVSPVVDEISGLPASVKLMENGDVRILGTGPAMLESETPIYRTVWDLLESWGSHWMWEHVSEEDRNKDLTWVREGMLAGSLVWCYDGSYKKKVAPTASGAGFCTARGLATLSRGIFLKYLMMLDHTEGSS